jgi:3-dehydroquinate dehydratase/shikimate dehydrogenase
MVENVEGALSDAAAAKAAGADIVEFRVDSPHLFSGSKGRAGEEEVRRVVRLASRSPLPCIVTCRATSEAGGTGGYEGEDAERVALYERLGTASGKDEHPPRYIDVEMATYSRSANLRQKVNLAVGRGADPETGQWHEARGGTGLILSMHDFTGRPADLLRRLAAMQAEPAASVMKVAYRARSLRDNLELFDLLRENAAGAGGAKPMIALAMGEFGLLSRVLAPKFGGFLTFAPLRPQTATAPGQPTINELLELYRFRSIGARTKVYGVIGWPVGHSLSPRVQNAAFAAIGADAVYLPLPVPPEYEHFKATLGALIDHAGLDFGGCSVTLPHKENLVRFAGEERARGACDWAVDELARLCGAANTLVVERSTGGEVVRCRVLNTDAPAATACLRAELGDLAGKRVMVIGAGGAARAIAAGLVSERATVVVVNRTPQRAEALARELMERTRGPGSIAPGTEESLAEAHAIVNCTPVGMTGGPAPGSLPLAHEAIARSGRQTVVMDTVYAPLETPLLRQARQRGLRTIDGLGMFVRQAALQFEAWTGRAAPAEVMERAAREGASE